MSFTAVERIICGGFYLSHFSCFFFRKRRNKRNQTEREKRRKATAVSLGVLEKRLFRIKCSDRFSSLRRDCGDKPRPQIRQYRICWFEEVGYTVSVRYKKQCCSDIVFCQISLVGPATFLKGAGGIFSKSPKKNPCVT